MAAVAQFRGTITPYMDFANAISAVRALSKSRRGGVRSAAPARVAVLGSTTTSQLAAFLDLFLFAHNVDAEIYEAPYGTMRQEILDPTFDLHRFRPHLIASATMV